MSVSLIEVQSGCIAQARFGICEISR